MEIENIFDNGRRLSCKKRESRKAFELRRQLNSHVGRRCAPDDRRRFHRPLNLHCRKGNVRLKRVLERHIADVFLQISRYYDKIMILS